MTNIKFGTDGWRAIIDQDFTDSNVSKVIQGFCDFHKEASNKLIYIGFDRRDRSQATAKLAACILAANGFEVRLAQTFCPTPCISWHVKTDKALAGVIITASHNPANWNGVKFKESYGGAAGPEYTDQVEACIETNEARGLKAQTLDYETCLKDNRITLFNPYEAYVKHLSQFVDVAAIKKCRFKIAVDPLFGSGTAYTAKALGFDISEIHTESDTNFGGLNPEPIEKNLQELKGLMQQGSYDIGLATDGDADRIGAFDDKGNFISSHQIFALLVLHNTRTRKYRGAIVKSITTTELLRKICEKENLTLIETPVGFKYISQKLLEHNALMGGEESGGISLREHVHERDGILNSLLLLEMMAVHQKNIGALIADMDAEFGKFYVNRDDYHLTDEKIKEVKAKVSRQDIKEVKGIAVNNYNTMDGVKINFSDSSWLMVRASGTEPLLRVYAEAMSAERVQDLLMFAKAYFELD